MHSLRSLSPPYDIESATCVCRSALLDEESRRTPKIVQFSHARYSRQKRCALHAHPVAAAVGRAMAAKAFLSAFASVTVAMMLPFCNTPVLACVDISSQIDLFQKMLTRCGLITSGPPKLN
jgi:hypothetical protein